MSTKAACSGVGVCADVMGWPQSYCKYPTWLSRSVWVQLDGQHVFAVDNASHVTLRAAVRLEVTSQPAVVKSLRCLRVIADRKTRSSSVFVAIAFVSHVWSVVYTYIQCRRHFRPNVRHATSICAGQSSRGVDPYGTGGTCLPNIFEGRGTSMVMSPPIIF